MTERECKRTIYERKRKKTFVDEFLDNKRSNFDHFTLGINRKTVIWSNLTTTGDPLLAKSFTGAIPAGKSFYRGIPTGASPLVNLFTRVEAPGVLSRDVK